MLLIFPIQGLHSPSVTVEIPRAEVLFEVLVCARPVGLPLVFARAEEDIEWG